MSHFVEVMISLGGLLAFIIYYRWNAKLDSKLFEAESILHNDEALKSSDVTNVFREERAAIRAIAKDSSKSPKDVARWVKSRLLS